MLRPALEAALDVAERGMQRTPPVVPPRGLRSVLGFRKRPPTALAAVRRVLDGDDDFRRTVADQADLVALGRGAAAYLERDDGWERELAQAVAAVNASDAEDRARESERAALGRVAELEARVEALGAADERLARVGEELDALRTRLNDEIEARAAAEQRSRDLEAQRQRAVRELADERRRLADRTAEARELRERVARGAAEVATSSDATDEPARLEAMVADQGAAAARQAERLCEVAQAARQVADALAALADPHSLAGWPEEAGRSDAERAGQGGDARGAASRVRRRTPVRVGRGLREGSPEAARALLDTPGLMLWVDGYNAAMALWENLSLPAQRDALVGALGRLAAAHGTDIRVVFDGADPEATVPAVRRPLPVRVRFTAADVEADDDILAAVAATDDAVPVAVLSADRRVRNGAAALGANLLSPDDLRALL